MPWTADGLRRAATVHLGGTLDEVVRSERQVAAGRPPDRPFTLFAQYQPVGSVAGPDGRHDRLGVLPRAGRRRRST